jgi:glycosyltransferase involved in cell wall biosynthesis
VKRPLRFLFALVAAPFFLVALVLIRPRRDTLVWTPVPILGNRWWSEAMQRGGHRSLTLMRDVYAINREEDFDLLFDAVTPRWIVPGVVRRALRPWFAFLWIARHASVVHIPFSGGPLGDTPLWRLEASLLRRLRIRSVVIPIGADVYAYSRIPDPSLRHALLLSYPDAARGERAIAERLDYWTRHADAIVVGFTLDGVGRWDATPANMVCIDTGLWGPKEEYSAANGHDGPVRILHAPNHRGFKGTEFLLRAVDEVQAEGLEVELVLLEGVSNDRVRQAMGEVDVFADQFVVTGYGLAAIEAMASGLPVLANLEDGPVTRFLRRYSTLGECPVVSTSPESLVDNLRALATSPDLRERLGRAGRQYAEKYHSYEFAQYYFGAIHARLLEGAEVDLLNLLHPAHSPYNRLRPPVDHPLVDGRLPDDAVGTPG